MRRDPGPITVCLEEPGSEKKRHSSRKPKRTGCSRQPQSGELKKTCHPSPWWGEGTRSGFEGSGETVEFFLRRRALLLPKRPETDQGRSENSRPGIETLADEGFGEGVTQSSKVRVAGRLTTHGPSASDGEQTIEGFAAPRLESFFGSHQDKDRLAGGLAFERLLERELPSVDPCQSVAL